VRETFVGTWALVRLALRRDRWMLPSWILAFVFMAGAAVSASAGGWPDEASRVEAARAINESAAMVAMFGRVYDPTSLGSLSMIKYTAFMTAAVAILMIVVAVRHTRAEEESGRLEVLSGGRLGRNAPLTAALIVVFGASLILGLLTSVSLTAAGLPGTGSLAFGLGWGVTGMAFGAVAAVAAQITTESRSATGAALSVVAVTYMLRAVGDLADPGPSVFSWLSPIGWNQQIRAYAGDRWWVFGLPLALCLVLVPVAFGLRARRDLGSGMREPGAGPAFGALKGVWGLARRLHSRMLVVWGVWVVLFGALIGSLANSVADFLSSDTMIEWLEKLGGTDVIEDAFISAEIGLVGIMISAYGVATVNRLRSEEVSGHAESLLGTSTTRIRWATSHYAAALMGVALLLTLLGFSCGIGAAASLGDASQIGRITLAGVAQIPAAWVMAGIALAVFGLMPKAAWATWVFLVAFIAIGVLGDTLGLPAWSTDISPFQHSPQLPLDSGSILPIVVLTVVAAVFAVAGYLGWRRRDLVP